ncbi:hypothetical protein [Ferruginibacter sp.]
MVFFLRRIIENNAGVIVIFSYNAQSFINCVKDFVKRKRDGKIKTKE